MLDGSSGKIIRQLTVDNGPPAPARYDLLFFVVAALLVGVFLGWYVGERGKR